MPKVESSITTTQKIEKICEQNIVSSLAKAEPFYPFKCEIDGKDTLKTSSEEEMQVKVKEITQQILDRHCKIEIAIPYFALERERKQAKEFITQLKNTVDIFPINKDKFYLLPKRTEEIQNKIGIRKYNNGVVEEVQSCEGKDPTNWTGRRIYPNGIIEIGNFNNFCLSSGKRTEKDKTIHVHPKNRRGKTSGFSTTASYN